MQREVLITLTEDSLIIMRKLLYDVGVWYS